MAWDTELKARRINPGTSADLTVATLFASGTATVIPDAGRRNEEKSHLKARTLPSARNSD